jgi:hypothetical protein
MSLVSSRNINPLLLRRPGGGRVTLSHGSRQRMVGNPAPFTQQPPASRKNSPWAAVSEAAVTGSVHQRQADGRAAASRRSHTPSRPPAARTHSPTGSAVSAAVSAAAHHRPAGGQAGSSRRPRTPSRAPAYGLARSHARTIVRASDRPRIALRRYQHRTTTGPPDRQRAQDVKRGLAVLRDIRRATRCGLDDVGKAALVKE